MSGVSEFPALGALSYVLEAHLGIPVLANLSYPSKLSSGKDLKCCLLMHCITAWPDRAGSISVHKAARIVTRVSILMRSISSLVITLWCCDRRLHSAFDNDYLSNRFF